MADTIQSIQRGNKRAKGSDDMSGMPLGDGEWATTEGKKRLVRSVAIGTFALALFFGTLLTVILPEHRARWFLAALAVSGMAVLLIRAEQTEHALTARRAFVASMFTLICVLCVLGGGTTVPAYWGFTLVVLVAALLLGKQWGLITGVVCALAALGIALMEMRGAFSAGAVVHTPFTRWLTAVLYIGFVVTLHRLIDGTYSAALARTQSLLRERTELEAIQRMAAERLALVTEAAEISTWDFNSDTGMVHGDARFRTIAGLSGEGGIEFREGEFKALIHAGDADMLLRPEEPARRSFRIVRPDGEVRHLLASVVRIADASGRPSRLIGANLDVTASVRAAEERTELVGRLAERVKELTTLHRASRLLQSDRAPSRKIFQELVELIPAGFLHPETCQACVVYGDMRAETSAQRAGLPSLQSGFALGELTGSIRVWYDPMPADTGEAELFLPEEDALLKSLAEMLGRYLEHHRANDSLQRREEEFRVIFEEAAIGIAVVDFSGRPVRSNHALQRMLGYSANELATMTFAEFTHPDDISRDYAAFQTLIAGERDSYQMEKRYLRKDGQQLWGRLTVSLIPSSSGSGEQAVGMVEDITERKRADEDRIRLESQLRQSQKMEAMGLLAGGVAHDFNNLITIISGYANLLLARHDPDPEVNDMLNEIRDAGMRAGTLTRQLLAFSRRAVYEPEVVDPNALVMDMERMLSRLIGEDFRLSTVLGEKCGWVKVDRGQLEQALVNLVVNSRDAMRGGGKITVSTANVVLSGEREFASGEATPGDYVLISVSDTGEGMDDATRSRIFEPFFTTKGRERGTGLGLAMVYGFVKQSDGHVDVTSMPGRGTTMRLYLPLTQRGSEAHRKTPVQMPLDAGHERIMLVEDDDAVRALTHHILLQCGYEVEAYGKPLLAATIPDAKLQRVDLLLTDVVMPELSGRQLADQLRLRFPELKVLFMSGYTDDAMVRHGVWASQAHFLPKPFTAQSLASKIRDVIGAQ